MNNEWHDYKKRPVFSRTGERGEKVALNSKEVVAAHERYGSRPGIGPLPLEEDYRRVHLQAVMSGKRVDWSKLLLPTP
ncbi:hypothetical protein CEXT_262811 [Caerostris extrusa]|uniref:Uncharacterized protein n=1 Tax=Caerostris extrusa TaxID=172846 RepID=A0AAV4WG26_CAEEX|nr:hypothetical protein CEXT_262811 [Caerostris extrusa]